jgi:hypothetical protein
MLKKLLLASVVLATTIPADAATFSYRTSAEFVFVKINGEILPGDDKMFADYTAKLPSGHTVVIELDSLGGSGAALNIGWHVYEREWDTVVFSNEVCASACALIWLAGSERWVGKHANIGFHAFYDPQTRQPSAAANAVAGAYLRDLGYGIDAIVEILNLPADKAVWLDAGMNEKYRLGALPLTN